ncbi:gluconate 2-dehydrogenase subunit 3 family protein [Horticoccus sp. 23ND18S-11]|uniref:gluconate 2-dehydrogenase subunit 3 family protein n=1 Tax=Horticoccus sp. 23ND18S-11 TaxID=3391832 RepID=UPI0039C9F37E
MNRREAIRQGGIATAAVALWAGLPARTWAALAAPASASAADEALLTLVGDTILPSTADSPGAGSIGIGRFILVMTEDCFSPETVVAVRTCGREVEAESRGRFARPFAALSQSEREAVLIAYEKRAAAETKGRALNPFRHVKELTLLGYFTSEPGATLALRYDPVPGGFRGSVPLAPSDRSWLQP